MRGKFFLVDKHSKFSEGQIIFRYMPVKKKPAEKVKDISITEKELTIFPKYPVYLAIKPFAIDFFYHRPERKNNTEPEDINTCILHLPLSLNLAVKDNLSHILNELYYSTVEIPEGYEVSAAGFNNAYWDTFKYPESPRDKYNEIINNMLPLKKLLLDFIYDLEHTTVFEASPHYEEAEVHLKENFAFSAISAKAAYYFNRHEYFKNEINKAPEQILAKKLADSEVQWLNILRDERALVNFSEQHWFNSLEKEHKDVLFDKEFPRFVWFDTMQEITNDKYFDKNKKILRESARWFLRRYSFWNGIKSIFQFYHNRLLWLTLAAIMSFVLFPVLMFNCNSNNQYFTNPTIIKLIIAFLFYFFLGIIPFVLIGAAIFWRMVLPILSLLTPRLMMAIASSWIIFITTEELVKTSFDVKFMDINKIWVFLLIIPIVAFMSVEIRNMAPDINAWALLRRMTGLIIIGFIYSLLIGMFFINSLTGTMLIRSGYLEDFYKSEVDTTKDNIQGKKFLYERDNLPDNDKKGYEELCKVSYKFDFDKNIKLNLKYNVPFIPQISVLETFEIFPGMLLYRAIFALFIGIFIQLIFEDKPITEPL